MHPTLDCDQGWVLKPIKNENTSSIYTDYTELLKDEINSISELYEQLAPGITEQHTIPVLVDKYSNRIVNNNVEDLMQMVSKEFTEFDDEEI
jgi:glutathionyl-hydroquinone reductase